MLFADLLCFLFIDAMAPAFDAADYFATPP